MSELEARFRVSLEGKDELSNFFRKSASDAKEFNKAITGALKDSAKEIGAFALSTGKSLGSLALGNIGIAAQAKSVLEFRDSVAQLAVTSGLGADAMSGLREQIHAVSKSSNQMQDDVTEALSAFVERTGDIETARKNLELYGKVATATGAKIKDVAYVGVELSDKLGIKDPAQQAKALAILAQQGKMGAVEIRDLATKAPKIFGAAHGYFGVEGLEGLRGTGALAQVFAKSFGGSGTSASVATSIDNMFKDMTKRKGLVDRMVGHNTTGQDPYEVIKQLIVATDGDTGKLLKNGKTGVFNMQALRGINALTSEYRATHGFATFDKFKGASDDFGNVEKDFALRRGTGKAALTASQISVAASADRNLGDKFDDLAHQADKLAKAFDWATAHLSVTAAALVAGVLAKNLGGNFIGMAIRGGQLGVQQVYIAGAAPGVLAGGPGGAAAAGSAMGKAFSVVAAAGIGYAIGTAIDQTFGVSDRVSKGLVNARQKTLDAAADRKLDARAEGVRFYEGQGKSHGAAIKAQLDVESAQHIFDQLNSAAKNISNQISINIMNDRVASVEENGTRSQVSITRRGMEPGERATP